MKRLLFIACFLVVLGVKAQNSQVKQSIVITEGDPKALTDVELRTLFFPKKKDSKEIIVYASTSPDVTEFISKKLQSNKKKKAIILSLENDEVAKRTEELKMILRKRSI